MTTYVIRPEHLPGILRAHEKRFPAAVRKGALRAAHRGRTHLVSVSPVDQGAFKSAWRVARDAEGYPMITNDAPYAGVIERGARPHPVSREGIENIKEWVKRKVLGGLTLAKYSAQQGRKVKRGSGSVSWVDREAESIAWAIAAKLKKEGQKGLYLVQNAVPLLADWTAVEVERAVREAIDAVGTGAP